MTSPKPATGTQTGAPAPQFTLPRDGGGRVSLADFRGQKVVVYFYPRDSTPGCTREAIDFSALADRFAAADTVVIGVSKDSVRRHDNFKAKNSLSVILASDEDGKVIDSYGVWVEKKLYGRTYMGIERATFLIDAAGKIAAVWHKVRLKGHAEAVLEAARAP